MMCVSGRADPGGSNALRTRCTRRSELVTVPSYSHQSAADGNTTSANSAVAVRKMSCTTRQSSPSNRCRACAAFASDSAGFSPMQYNADNCPRSIASNISDRCIPATGGTVAPHAVSKRCRAPSSPRS